MTRKQKKRLIRIIIALVLFLIVFITDIVLKKAFTDSYPRGLGSLINNEWGWLVPFFLYLGIYIYIGYDILKKAFINIIHGQMLDENFLMTIATIGAFALGIYSSLNSTEIEGFDEACGVLIFYQVGEWFQSYAVSKSRKSISSLMDIRPDFANVKRENGEYEIVDPSEVAINDIILVKPGERVPLDGIVISGSSSLDTKALTGESLPRDVNMGDDVISGCVNLSGAIEIKVVSEFSNSTVAKILDLVENASNNKAKSENFITKFSKVYTPIVVGCALALCIIPTIIHLINPSVVAEGFDEWLYRSLTFLVVSCPCALVISIPLSFFAGIGGASRNGILVKGSVYLENFNKTKTFVFDKTGTLTKGNFKVVGIYPEEKKEEILKLAAIAELNSNHPIAVSIRNEYGNTIDNSYSLTDVSGEGIIASGEDTIYCGNEKLMKNNNINYIVNDEIGTIVYVAKNNEFVGSIVIRDEIKPEAKDMIAALNKSGARTIMLTGDNEKIASAVAKELGLTEYRSSLLPQNKVEELNKILANKKPNELVCFVGDGINDAPVLMQSDIGIAMGGVGSDAAIEASDIVLMYDDLKSIPVAKKIAKKTIRIVNENIYFAIGVKILILILSAFAVFGKLGMWIAVFGDVGVAVIAILNAMRANVKKID